jgi:tRNA pseudouridine55 synthase
MTKPPQVDGFLIVNKPTGMTSHDVVGRCRRIVGQKRVGHSGTLDPGATGILLVGLGRATRLMQFLGEHPKSYTAQIVLGSATTTLDADGEITETWDMSHVTPEQVAKAAEMQRGDILQVPPMVSAVKVNGKRLHQSARAGEVIEREPRPVTVFDITTSPTEEPGIYDLSVRCSSGTYVRTIAADIGTQLGGGAHLRNLVRSAIGDFDLSRSTDLDDLEDNWRESLLTPAEMVSHLPAVKVDEPGFDHVRHGRKLGSEYGSGLAPGNCAVVDGNANLLGIYENRSGEQLRPVMVLAAE